MFKNKFGITLRQLRIAREWSQCQLAKQIGVSVSYISKLEKGACPAPSANTLSKLASTLKADVNELFNLAGKLPYEIWQKERERAIPEFGPKLRELRRKSGLSQLKLASQANVDISYISKLETGAMPPPSRKVQLRLAKALRVNKNELISIAGKSPYVTLEQKEEGKMLKDIYQSIRSTMRVPNLSPSMSKAWVRVAISVLLVVGIAGGLWIASPNPAEAVTVSFPSTPAGNRGSSHTFQVRVDISGATDLLPVQSIDIWVKNQTGGYNYTLRGVPLTATTKTFSPSGAGTVSVTTTPGSTWGYATSGATTHYGYGYGYTTGTWGTQDFAPTAGFGYGYSTGGTGDTYIVFNVTWTPPSSWPTGTYNTNAIVYGNGGDSKALTSDTPGSFTISAAAPEEPTPTPSPVGTGPAPTESVSDISDIVDADGEFTDSVTVESDDGNIELSISEGTIGEIDGEPLTEITIVKELSPPALPEDSSFVGMPYDLGPDGATFDPAITLTFSYDPAQIPDGVGPESLNLAYFDQETESWVPLDPTSISIDPETGTITAEIEHFTLFTVMAGTAPADFTVSGLVYPTTSIGIAEQATISAMVANIGDATGTTTVTLKINGAAVASKNIKLAGHESRSVSFVTVQGKPGDYKVEIDGLSGTYTVKAVSVGPVVITSTVPSITVPAVQPSAPTAPVVPAAPAPPAPAPVPWLAIIIVLVVAVVVSSILVWNYGFRTRY